MSRTPPKVLVIDEPEQFGAVAAEHLLKAIQGCVAATGRCRLGLAGGSSPGPVLRALSKHPLSDVIVTWVDERHTDGAAEALADDRDWRALPADSNQRGALESGLFAHPQIKTVSMHRVGSLNQAKTAYEADFHAILDGGLDVLLLGLGPDGHIASLFPDHPLLDQPGPVLSISDSPKPPAQRITLSLPVLEDVRSVVVVATGGGKASALAKAYAADPSLPLGRYQPKTDDVLWVLDPQAADLIPREEP